MKSNITFFDSILQFHYWEVCSINSCYLLQSVSLTAEMGERGSLLLWLLFLCCCLGATSPATSKYWVVPAKEDCQHKENCSTLEEYVKTGAFNQSNVVWVFKEGKHVLNGTIVPFANVHNVTLRGSRECEPPDINNCIIECKGDQVCMFLFVTSHNITIGNLTFVHQDTFDLNPVSENTLRQYLPEEQNLCYSHSLGFPKSMTHVYFKNCLHDRSWVFVDTVHVTVRNVNFIGRNSYWAVVRPNGNYQVLNCQFHELFLTQSSVSGDAQHYMTVVLRKPQMNQSTLVFMITNSSFRSKQYMPSKGFVHGEIGSRLDVIMTYPAVHIISDVPLSGWKANITIEHCRFCQCSPFQLTAIEDPGLTVTLKTVRANGNASVLRSWQRQLNYTTMGSAVRLFLANANNLTIEPIQCPVNTLHCHVNSSSPLSNVTITSSQFTSYRSGEGCVVLFEGHFTDLCPKWLRIVLHNNTFMNCSSKKFRSVVYAYQHRADTKSQHKRSDHEIHRLVIDSNRSEQNFKKDKMDTSCVVFDRQNQEGGLVYLKRPGNTAYRHTCQEKCIWQGVYFINGFEHQDRVLFTGNVISMNIAQGLTLVGSVLELDGENYIQGNEAHYGGGIAMHGNSQLWIRNGSYLSISNNHALVSGGGIVIRNPCTLLPSKHCPCFFQFIGSDGKSIRTSSVDTFNASVIFHKNRAANHANMMFNTNSDRCWLKGSLQASIKRELFHRVFGIPMNKTQEDISSIPHRICNCSHDTNEGPNCTDWKQDPIPLYPGQNITLNVMLIGDMGIPLEGMLYINLDIQKHINDPKQYVPLPLHSTHILRNVCNTLIIPPLPPKDHCRILTANHDNNWVLQIVVPLVPHKHLNVFLSMNLPTKDLPCPSGYSLVNQSTQCHCECYRLLSDKNVQCSLNTQEFILPQNYWIGTKQEQERTTSIKLLLSSDCPRLYCDTPNTEKYVLLNESDKQCRHNRTGVLCGQCPNGKSVVYNSCDCKTCTNWGVFLLVPLLIAGPMLIALICCLNLTISIGSINGFLLYTNVIAINRDVLTTNIGNLDSTPVQQVLELTIGICFYDGMDEFASTMFTFLFPMYLLTLVGLICLLPKCKCVNMHKINRRIGPRITPVLATVILLSYTQLAESVIRSLLYVELFETDGTTTTSRLVWMFDGSLEYFHSPKHIILACLALLVLTCFLLPVTVIAIFGDLFRRFFRGPWYMNFLDSFHGAFRFRFGFWIGIRILLFILSIVLKIFLPMDELFLVTAYTIMTLLFVQILIRPFRGIRIDECVSQRVKEKHFPEPLQRDLVHSIDHSFLVNLIAVFVYLPHNAKRTVTVLIISKVVAYVEFVCILVYHVLEYSPLGPFIFDTWFKLRQKYRRRREKRREAALAKKRNKSEEGVPCEEQFDLVLRASDCKDSDYENSESDDESMKETRSDHQDNKTMTKQACDERDIGNRPVGSSPSRGLTAPLLRKMPAGST